MNYSGGAQNHDKERDMNKHNEDQGNPEAMEIDLKCAEKVTDSDVESNADEKVRALKCPQRQALTFR